MMGNVGANENRPRAASSHHSRSYTNEYNMHPPELRRTATADPTMNSAAIDPPDETESQGYKNAVRAWSRFRFVRAGWFTAAEAIDYIT